MMRTMFAFFFLCLLSFSLAFSPSLPSLKSILTVVHLSDFDGFIGDDNEAGQALAVEFSKEVQARKQQQQQEARTKLLSEEELRMIHNNKRRQVVTSRVKEMSSSAGFFSGQGQTLYSFPSNTAVRPNGVETPNTDMMVNGALFLPTMAILVLLSVYLTFSAAPRVEDWPVQDVPVEQVGVFL